jgi:hypothetical protein
VRLAASSTIRENGRKKIHHEDTKITKKSNRPANRKRRENLIDFAFALLRAFVVNRLT